MISARYFELLHLMSFDNRIDYMIVGQGLAGSCLALQLIKRGKKILLFDDERENSASGVAAGLFNPVTGKMMTKTWKADVLFPYLHHFYSEAEVFLNGKFFHPFPLYRPFVSIEEQNEWMGKSSEPGMMEYIDEVFSSSAFSNVVNDPFGGLLLKNCGYVDVPALIKSVREFLVQQNSYLSEHFEEKLLTIEGDKVRYKSLDAQKAIFCNGVDSLNGISFNNISIRPLKGETLLIQLPLKAERIYNRGVYAVPSADEGFYKVGATYNTKDKSEGITESGKEELEEKLKALIRIPYQVEGQNWGFRPTTPDRRPILGPHPDHPHLVMFNGLGTKGVSLAPYFSKALADWLEGIAEIDQLVNIARYY